MIFRLLKSMGSMVSSPLRMKGRSWSTELMNRTVRGLFIEGHSRGQSWLRAQMDASSGYHPAIAKVSMNTRDIAGVQCMMISPKQGASSDKVVVYFHGGGYVAGSAQSHKTILAQLALDTQGLIIAPNYRLAPEYPFPAPQEDCLTVSMAVLKTYNDKKITLAGDSAGGALAIATTLELANNSSLNVDNIVLLSPWVEPAATGGSMVANKKNDFLMPEFLELGFSSLMQGGDLNDHNVNFATVDLANLPKTLVQCGEGEIFLDQIQAFCDRAKDVGVDIELQRYPAQFHVFQLFSAILKDAKVAVAAISKFINQA